MLVLLLWGGGAVRRWGGIGRGGDRGGGRGESCGGRQRGPAAAGAVAAAEGERGEQAGSLPLAPPQTIETANDFDFKLIGEG